MNRVQWGCCEQRDEYSSSTKGTKFTISRVTAASKENSGLWGTHPSLTEDILRFRVGCQCQECSVLVHLQEMPRRNRCRHENYANCSTLHSGRGVGVGVDI